MPGPHRKMVTQEESATVSAFSASGAQTYVSSACGEVHASFVEGRHMSTPSVSTQPHGGTALRSAARGPPACMHSVTWYRIIMRDLQA